MRQIERDAANRRRAVLLTAKAQALADSDPTTAKDRCLEANRLRPDFVPAAAVAAQLPVSAERCAQGRKDPRGGVEGRAASGDRRTLHPCRPGDAVLDRLNRREEAAGDEEEPRRSRRWRSPAPRSTRRISTTARASRRSGDPHGPPRRRLSALGRHRGGRDRRPGQGAATVCRGRYARRAIRPGLPTASSPSAGRRYRRSPAGSTPSSGACRSNGWGR